jgi:replicative DNA helicase
MERKLLTDITVERIILAYAIVSYDNFINVLSSVSEKDFIIPFNKLLFRACCNVYKYEITLIDKLTLINEILGYFTVKKKDNIVKVCEEARLNTATNINIQIDSLYEITSSFDFTNIDLYIKKLINISKKNKLISYLDDKADNLEGVLTNHDVKSVDVINDVEFGLLNLMQNDDVSDDPEDIFLNMDLYVDKILNNKVDMIGLSTGFPILDDRIDGLVNGTLNIIAAFKKGGKSACCMNIALHVAFKLGIPILYIDTEMSTEQNYSRILSRLTKIPEKRIKRGNLTDAEKELVVLAAKILKNKEKYYHKYMPGFTIEAVVALIKKYHTKYGIGLVIFDYIKSGSQEDFSTIKEYQLLGNTTIALKDISGILNIPILAAVQRARSGDIADSDRIARYGDTIIVLEEKTKEEIEKLGFTGGLYKFFVRYSRRGGETPYEGIGVHFRKSILNIQEADIQLIDYKEYEATEEEYEEMKDELVDDVKPKKDKSKVADIANLW